MAISKKMGAFTLPAAGGSVAITGVGFQPKVIIIFHTGPANAAGAEFNFGFGVAQSTTQRYAIGNIYYDNDSPATLYPGGQSWTATGCVSRTGLYSGFSFQVHVASFTSMDADGFTLNAGTALDSLPTYCRYLALGGADLDVKVGSLTAPTATGTQAITGVGFQPKGLLLFSNEVTNKNIEAQTVFGVAASTSKQYTTLFSGSDDGTNTYNYNRQLTGKIYTQIQPENQANIEREAVLNSFDADGFTLGWTVSAAESAHTIVYIALAGAASFDAGLLTQPTSTGNQDVTSTVAPDVLMLFSAAKATNTGSTTEAKLAFGVALDSSNQWGFGGHARHAINPSDANKDFDSTKVLLMMTNATRNAVASFVQPNSPNGFRLNWSTADATQRETIFFGIQAAPPDTSLQGAGAAQAGATAALTTQIPLAGAAVTVSTATANITSGIPLAALAAGAASAAADMSSGIPLGGAASGAASGTASLTTDGPMNASAQVTVSASGSLSASITFSASALVQALASGALSTAINAAADASGQSGASGALTSGIPLGGQGAGQVSAGGAITSGIPLGAQGVGQVSASADLTAGSSLAAAAQVIAAAAADLTIQIRLNGAALAQALASAGLTAGGGLGANASAQSSASANLLTQIPLLSAALSTASATANIITLIPLQAAGASIASGVGSLSISVRLAASAAVKALAAGELTTTIRLDADAVARAAANGSLSTEPVAETPVSRTVRIPADDRTLRIAA